MPQTPRQMAFYIKVLNFSDYATARLSGRLGFFLALGQAWRLRFTGLFGSGLGFFFAFTPDHQHFADMLYGRCGQRIANFVEPTATLFAFIGKSADFDEFMRY